MWEARAAPGRAPELIAHLIERLDGAAAVYRGLDEERVVVIDPTGRLPDVPAELMARSPHSWRFESVQRHTADGAS